MIGYMGFTLTEDVYKYMFRLAEERLPKKKAEKDDKYIIWNWIEDANEIGLLLKQALCYNGTYYRVIPRLYHNLTT